MWTVNLWAPSSLRSRRAILGPFLCGLWLSSGIKWVSARRGSAGAKCGFIDDRTFSAPTAQGLVDEVESWQLWSGLVGLKESVGKAQVVAKTAKQKRDLDSLRPVDIQQTDATFLGVTTRGKPRKNSAKESERMKSASMCLNLLSTLKLPYAVFTRYARMFGVPLVSYGWFAKLPTLGETKKLWSTIKRGQRTGLMANAWIRAIIYGGVHHLDCVTATQLLRVVSALFAQGWVTWNSTTGCPVHSLRNWAGKNKLSC